MEDGAVAAIRRHVDEFEGVPVISFGWVALFILLYTLLIGPVEYLFLKKILGRLELTWITFPIIVLSVSAAAYFTAYYIKGKDLRINKIDVVDIDVQGKRVYGRTFFTVFSPRVDSYTVGIEPKPPWAAEPAYGSPLPPSMVDWLGGLRPGTGGGSKYRSYRYELDDTGKGSSGMVNVPIQVWSTKSFVTNWSGVFDPAKPPVTADLTHPPANPRAASGRITANLPLGNLQEGFAFFAGNAYKLDALPDGQAVRFDSSNQRETEWEKKVNLFDAKFSSDDMYDDFGGRRTARTAGVSAAGPLSLWGVLLGDRAGRYANKSAQNSSVRTLDQSWRLDPRNTEEVMIVAKLARATGPAEQLMADPRQHVAVEAVATGAARPGAAGAGAGHPATRDLRPHLRPGEAGRRCQVTATRPVTYRRMTPDEVLAELRLFCRYEFGFNDARAEKAVRVDATLAELGAAMHHDEDLSDLELHFHLKLSREWWAQWTRDHTVGELCANLATGTLVPVLEAVSILGNRCETAGAFLTLKQMLADDGADVSELGPSSEVLPYLRAKPDVFRRFRLAVAGRLPVFGGIPPQSCLVGSLLVIAGAVLICVAGAQWLWLFASGAGMAAFGLSRPTRYPCLAHGRVTTFRDLICTALGRTPRTRAA